MQKHELDSVSLTFGLIFLGIANAWLMVATGAAEVEGLRWFFPALLLGAGAAGMVTSLLRERRIRNEATSGGTAEATSDTTSDATVVDTPGDRP